MKKTCIIGILTAICGMAQATSITLISGATDGSVQINGNNAYLYLIQISLGANQTISSASVYFNNIELVSSDAKDTVSAALVTQNLPTHTYTDNDNSGNYFANSPFNGSYIGKAQQFTAPQSGGGWTFTGGKWVYVQPYTIYDTESWSVSFDSTQLAAINNAGGTFDIGIDPDCYYDVLGSIYLSYNITTSSNNRVPDQATTAGLLGISMLGLGAFRRKFVLAKNQA